MSHRRLGGTLTALAIVLTACTSGGGATASPSSAATPAGSTAASPSGSAAGECLVGVSWNNYQQERWAKADEPAIQAALTAGGATYARTDARDDESQQLTDIDSLINQGAKVLIVLAKDSVAIQPAVDKAKAAGIPVIAYDRLIFDPETFYISFNNQGVGAVMAEVMTKTVTSGNYVIIKGHKADPNADFLRAGMDPFLKPLVDSGAIKIVYEDYTDTWKTENAQKNMETALNQTNNDVQAVISENDSMAIGVIGALERVGLAGTVPVTGQDGDKANLNQVALGNQLVDVWKDAFALGETAGSVAAQLCKGTAMADVKAPDTLKDHVRPDSLDAVDFSTKDPSGKDVTVKSIILKPTPVTKDNLNLPIDLGWVTKADACKDVDPATGPAACK
jgi:D-xylose transport system substrate-binding protein